MSDQTRQPRPAATPFGTVMVLGDTGDLLTDLEAALDACGVNDAPDRDNLERMIANERESRGLRAEAGYATGLFILVLQTHSEKLATGVRVGCFLTFSQTQKWGDAVYFNVSIMDRDFAAVSFANREAAWGLLSTLRKAAGGPSAEFADNWHTVPAEEG
jgi:hypothetical protein